MTLAVMDVSVGLPRMILGSWAYIPIVEQIKQVMKIKRVL
jgi:hypothetical protein